MSASSRFVKLQPQSHIIQQEHSITVLSRDYHRGVGGLPRLPKSYYPKPLMLLVFEDTLGGLEYKNIMVDGHEADHRE